MSLADVAEQTLKGGDPVAALAQLQEQVRAKPADPKLRIFLFQLLCVVGQWERALNQLNVASSLDPAALPMAQTYGDAVRCETLRDDVFEGKKSPKRDLPTGVLRAIAPAGPVVGKLMGFPPNFKELISVSDGVTYWAKDDKARSELGYSPRDLETGLRQTLDGA